MQQALRILEIGCGTGVILADLTPHPQTEVYGLDINRKFLELAASRLSPHQLIQADGNMLPFPNQDFNLTFCHFLLLWVADPENIIAEMKRVTVPGGAILALAEPDYGSRIDYPEQLSQLGEWQKIALGNQGADTLIGRQLGRIFSHAGLEDLEMGIISAQWKLPASHEDIALEWKTIRSDLAGRIFDSELDRLQKADELAWTTGERVLFVPTFYAWGRVPA